MKTNRRFHVGVYYQTPTSRAGAKNFIIDNAKSEEEALNKAIKIFMQNKKGKGYKIQGGDAYLIKNEHK